VRHSDASNAREARPGDRALEIGRLQSRKFKADGGATAPGLNVATRVRNGRFVAVMARWPGGGVAVVSARPRQTGGGGRRRPHDERLFARLPLIHGVFTTGACGPWTVDRGPWTCPGWSAMMREQDGPAWRGERCRTRGYLTGAWRGWEQIGE